MPPARADLHDLSLPLISSGQTGEPVPCGKILRQSICKAIVARAKLELPAKDEAITWSSWGVVLPTRCQSQTPTASSLWDLYSRMRVCLNLPRARFAKPGYYVYLDSTLSPVPMKISTTLCCIFAVPFAFSR